jgi:type VI secretion system protein ImpF
LSLSLGFGMAVGATAGSTAAGASPQQRAQLPLLDRLMDAQPDNPGAEPLNAHEALQRLRAAVLRDLEALLNARRRRLPLPLHTPQLADSLLGYGIPDPASGAFGVPEIRAELAAEVEASIRRFEPRLTEVRVSLANDGDILGATLKLKVDAVLRAEPVPEDLSFETLLEPVTRDVILKEG